MVELYSASDVETVAQQKKKCLILYFVSLGVILAITVSILIFYTTLEYATPLKTPLLVTECIVSGLFVIFSFLFLGIKVKRAKCYLKLITSILEIEQVEGKHTFVRHEHDTVVKDGVDFTALVFLEWSDKQHDFYETKIYLDDEKSIPEFKKGDVIYHKTHANVLTAYEIRNEDIFE